MFTDLPTFYDNKNDDKYIDTLQQLDCEYLKYCTSEFRVSVVLCASDARLMRVVIVRLRIFCGLPRLIQSSASQLTERLAPVGRINMVSEIDFEVLSV